jgi:uncharacterized protein YycO
MGLNQPRVGDYFVVRTNGLAAWLIRLGTRSPVNHAGVFVGDGAIIEAQPGGAVRSPVTDYPNAIWSDLPLTDSDRASIAHWATAQVGVPYGWPDIAALTLACFGIKPRFVAKRIERMDRLICSQLCDKAYLLAGVHLFDDGRLTGEVTPGALLHLIVDSRKAT